MSFQAQGMRAWLVQRLTAVYIAVYILSLMVWMLSNSPLTFTVWSGLLSQPVTMIATVLFYVALFVHAWVGVRDILVDYAKPSSVRFILLTLLALFLIIMTIWLLIIFISLVKV